MMNKEKNNEYLIRIDILEQEIKKLKEQIKSKNTLSDYYPKKVYISFEERKEKALEVLRKYYPKPVNLITITTEGKLNNIVANIVLSDLLHYGIIKELCGSWRNTYRDDNKKKHKVGRLFVLSERKEKRKL